MGYGKGKGIWDMGKGYGIKANGCWLRAIPCRLGEIALRNFIDGAVKTKILSERSEFIFVQRRR